MIFLEEMQLTVGGLPLGLEFLCSFFPVLDPRRTFCTGDPADRHGIIGGVHDPRSVHGFGQITQLADILFRFRILDFNPLVMPFDIFSGIDIIGLSQSAGGSRQQTGSQYSQFYKIKISHHHDHFAFLTGNTMGRTGTSIRSFTLPSG